jgi:hypothetical protein
LIAQASGGTFGPVGPHGTEDNGATAMDYLAVVAGLFRAIQQVANVHVDFIDEDGLNVHDLAPFKALIITTPDLPAEGAGAVASWVQGGGHLLTVASAGSTDRYNKPASVLQAVTGVTEALRRRRMLFSSAELVSVANGTGDLGPISAFGCGAAPGRCGKYKGEMVPAVPGTGGVTGDHLLGNVTALDPTVHVLANFSDGSPAILRNTPTGTGNGTVKGKGGSATHFTFFPCVHFNQIDPFHPMDFDNVTNFTDGTLPYIMRFLDDAGVAPRARVSALQVETPLIVSAEGAVLSLLNWRDSAVAGLDVSVRLGFQVGRVTAVRAMHPENADVPFTSTPVQGGGGEFFANFTVALLEHSDFVMLHKK